MANSEDGLPRKTLLYACSGAANTGVLADQAARLPANQGAGDTTCLVSMGANQPKFLQAARDAQMLRGAAALIVLTLLLAGCSKTASPKAQVAESAPKALVTFVELGSVNCVPCRMMQPIMRDIENAYQGQVKVVFHDVWTDEGKPYAKTYGIRVIPTQVFLDSKGVEYFRHEGYFPRDQLVAVLETKGVK
jgi:thioredoxin 1